MEAVLWLIKRAQFFYSPGRVKRNLRKKCRLTCGRQAYCLTECPVKLGDTSCAYERIGYATNYVCLNVHQDANEAVHLPHFLSATDASTLGSKQYNRYTFQILREWQGRRTSHAYVPPSLPPPLIFKAMVKIFVTLPSYKSDLR